MIALLLAVSLAAPVRALAEKVEAELEAWDLAGATRALDELSQEHPDSAETSYLRGRVLFEQGRYDEATKAYALAEERG
ncbi:MAG TPA: tetratricopeptide repeat protein, partial [Myxococcales bacterium]|nr:tetratricopeptide repeat protein [Myxococcales bacterium]